ncbi:MAG: DMT family transporter [Lachnospiraceae bacterium]|jgi:drug/metabolite transporter (DMT)-like permease|nr:DMT family transporter [Lachnospiraceae bacterium]MCI1327992.1 DMT family transporter [Lachnospiraceae bacterium]
MSGNTKGVLILLSASLIWGMSFPAQDIVVDHHVGTFTFNCLRSLIAAALLLAIQIVRMRKGVLRDTLLAAGTAAAPDEPSFFCQDRKMTLSAGIFCGIALFFGIGLQQYGMQIYPEGVASSGRAGFLTATYVVIVAIASVFLGRKPRPVTLIAAGVCLLGMYFLCLAGGISGVYTGDLLMLLDAFAFSVQILLIDHFSAVDGLTLSFLQFFTCGILSLIGMLLFETVSKGSIASILIPLLYCGVGSSACGYTLQIIGQRYADPAPASIAMSMESVFSGIGGWLLLGQTMSGRELLGCGLVFFAVILTQIPPFSVKNIVPSHIQRFFNTKDR